MNKEEGERGSGLDLVSYQASRDGPAREASPAPERVKRLTVGLGGTQLSAGHLGQGPARR